MRDLLQRLAFTWRTAYSCLYIQLCAYQEMKMADVTPMLMSDDASEEELTEMAKEQRELDELRIRP